METSLTTILAALCYAVAILFFIMAGAGRRTMELGWFGLALLAAGHLILLLG